MNTEEYGNAYEMGLTRTARLLVSRGISWDCAEDIAQAAWAKGWEKRHQLRDPKMLGTWVSTIALNMYRSNLRHEPFSQELPEMLTTSTLNLESIDLRRVLARCKKSDRLVLQRYYFEGDKVREIAQAHGLTETAVRIRLLRARRAVAKRLAA
jgi:RNA polymerase sigma factor (sigma-70 family)